MSPPQVLSRAQAALHTPNGASKALNYLEEEVRRSREIGNDAGVWACIAHLRRKQGDIEGGDEAERTARNLATQVSECSTRRKLEFVEGNVREKKREIEVEKCVKSARCTELLGEIGIGKMGGKVDRLVNRTRMLRLLSKGLLDMEEG